MIFECRICGNAAGNRVHTAREMMFGTREEFDYVECAGCGTVQIVEIPDLSSYYPENYYSFDTAPARGLRHRLAMLTARLRIFSGNGALQRSSAAVASAVGNLAGVDLRNDILDMGLGLASVLRLGLRPGSRILDVGCGDGKLLSVLADLGFRPLNGIDTFIKADRSLENGVRIRRVSLEELAEKFDLVMFNHSFEHVPDPASTLGEVRPRLNAEGVCLIRIPLAAYAWETYGTNWVGLDPPRHLHLFTERSFRQLAEKCGFRVEEVVYDSTVFQFVGSEQYALDIPLVESPPANSLFTRRQIREWAAEARGLNKKERGDQAAFYLKAM